MKKNFFQPLMALPFIVSAAGILFVHWSVGLLSLILVIVLVALNPKCRHRESLWIFVITAFSTIPLNIYFGNAMASFCDKQLLRHGFEVFLFWTMGYIAGFSAEEIVNGIIGRIIWKKQYKTDW